MSIQWREEMAIDHGPIDADHKTLIGIINAFCDTPPTAAALPQLQAILDKLHQYTAIHFRREEALQATVQYPYLDAHHHEHLDLIRRLGQLGGQLTQFTASDPAEATADPEGAGLRERQRTEAVATIHAHIAAFVRDWLVDHIIKSDLRMRPYAAKMAQHTRGLPSLEQAVF